MSGSSPGSTTMSEWGIPWSAARFTIFFATSNRTSGSVEIPVSSLVIATTATTTAMKVAGDSSPRSGCTQRSSASMPTTLPLRMSTWGW